MNKCISLVVLTIILIAFPKLVMAFDSDSDGLEDTVETNTGIYIGPLDSGTDPLNPDTDGDGVLDGPEVYLGSHPLDNLIVPSARRAAPPVNITTGGTATYPSLVWNGMSYGLAWEDSRFGSTNYEIYFAGFDYTGAKIIPDINVTNNGFSGLTTNDCNPQIIWNGREYGMTWTYSNLRYGLPYPSVKFARLNSLGSVIGNIINFYTLGANSVIGQVDWTGSEYGLGYVYDIFTSPRASFSRVSSSGSIIGSRTDISNISIDIMDSTLIPPSRGLIWNGSMHGGVAINDRKIIFARISPTGGVIGPVILLTNADGYYSTGPTIDWSGADFGVAWNDNRYGNYEIVFTRVSAGGEKIGDDVRITNSAGDSRFPSLIWNGKVHGLAWQEGSSLYFTMVSPEGFKVMPEVKIADNVSSLPSLQWTGFEFGVAYSSSGNIGYVRIHIDEDGDTLDTSDEQNQGTDEHDWDTDDDTISDGDEFWNPTLDPLHPDIPCGPGTDIGLYCWGDLDGDGAITGLDSIELDSYILRKSSSFPGVYPSNGDTFDIDGDGGVSGKDAIILRNLLLHKSAMMAPPANITLVNPLISPSVPIGGFQMITVQISDADGTPRSGVGVVFTVTGPGRLLGGRGNAAGLPNPDGGVFAAGGRWDVTGPMSEGGVASITVRVDGSGPITINAGIPSNTAKQLYASLVLSTPVTINP